MQIVIASKLNYVHLRLEMLVLRPVSSIDRAIHVVKITAQYFETVADAMCETLY